MKSFWPPKKLILWIRFSLFICMFVTQSKAQRMFFIFDPHRERSLVNSILSVSPLVHRKLQNNSRIFLIFFKKGTIWKDGTFFEENYVPLSNLEQIWAQNLKTSLMIILLICTVMEGNSVQVSTICQTKYSFTINLGKCGSKNQTVC